MKNFIVPLGLSFAVSLAASCDSRKDLEQGMPKQEKSTIFSQASKPRVTDQVEMVKQASAKTLAEQLGHVLDGTNYLFLQDNHNYAASHQFVANADVLKIAADNGVKRICLEVFDHGAEIIFNAYINGEIPINAAGYYFQVFLPDIEIIPPIVRSDVIRSILAMGIEAKKHGIEMHAVDHRDGQMLPADYEVLRKFEELKAKFFISRLKDFKGLKKLRNAQLQPLFLEIENTFFEKHAAEVTSVNNYLTENVDKKNFERFMAALEAENPEAVKKLRSNPNFGADLDFGILQRQLKPETLSKIEMGILYDRLKQDPEVAQRITETLQQGGKAIIIYGAAHLCRKEGDIDASVGEESTRTLHVYRGEDEKKRSDLDFESVISEFKRYGAEIDISDTPNFTLDLSSGTWTDSQGKATQITLPETLKDPSITNVLPMSPRPTP